MNGPRPFDTVPGAWSTRCGDGGAGRQHALRPSADL